MLNKIKNHLKLILIIGSAILFIYFLSLFDNPATRYSVFYASVMLVFGLFLVCSFPRDPIDKKEEKDNRDTPLSNSIIDRLKVGVELYKDLEYKIDNPVIENYVNLIRYKTAVLCDYLEKNPDKASLAIKLVNVDQPMVIKLANSYCTWSNAAWNVIGKGVSLDDIELSLKLYVVEYDKEILKIIQSDLADINATTKVIKEELKDVHSNALVIKDTNLDLASKNIDFEKKIKYDSNKYAKTDANGYPLEFGKHPGYPFPTYFEVDLLKTKSKSIILAAVLGGVGAPWFYLERPGLGVIHILFLPTGLSIIAGFIEAIYFYSLPDEKFYKYFCKIEE